MSARVLVVDDLLPNVKLLMTKLAQEYYDVITATSGAEALDILRKDPVDIVLLDVMMPGMDGFEVCRRLRANPAISHVPVIMVTALSDVSDRVKGLQAGADDFLTKPVDDTALFARIRSLVRLKTMLDEWRLRESTSSQFGVTENAPPPAQEDSGQEASILLINNRPFEADKTKSILAIDQHQISVFKSSREGAESLQRSDYDLIICDVMGEEEDSLRFCSNVRSDERTRQTPILMVADVHEIDRINRALDMGVNDYLVRPVDRHELLARTRTQVRRRRYQLQLRQNYERSLALALIDPLTETFNRRYVTAHLPRLLEKAAQTQKPLTAMMVDIDHFKKVNDTYGHTVGDEVLRELGLRISAQLRSFDMAARMGGEEFLIVMLGADPDGGLIIGDRLRKAVADKPFNVSTPEGSLHVTVSIGVTLSRPEDSLETLVKRADELMYEAKKEGRNRVKLAT